jgi:hypothetical protein
VIPDFVVDDLPEIVGYFGGYLIPEFYGAADDDDEMQAVYDAVKDWSATGRSASPNWRPSLLTTKRAGAGDG